MTWRIKASGFVCLDGVFLRRRVQKDKIVALRIKRFEPRELAPGLIERVIPTPELRPLDPEVPTAPIPSAPKEENPAPKGKPKKAKEFAVKPKEVAVGIGTLSQ